MRTHEERLTVLDEILTDAADRGLLMRTPDDDLLDGRTIAFDGASCLNFGSCSYLGLEHDPSMREAVCDAVMRYGTQFSSSRGYLSAPPYPQLEERLGQMFGGHVLVAPTTTLGHLAALPALVASADAVVLDQQVHQSVQMAANQLRVQGCPVEIIRHNRIDQLTEAIERLTAAGHPRVWYMADGVYSMFADLAPFDELRQMLDRFPQLQLYIDDSHGVGWAGRHGRGPALDALAGHPRLIVAASLNKSFAAAGGALVFPNAELKRRVRTVGGPMLFSGPVQPPMLGAALRSAAIHLSDELDARQALLRERIALCTELMEEFCLPLVAHDTTPIRYVVLGLPRVAQDVVERLMDDGIYTNLGVFPAVPMKQAGVRITLTVHHSEDDIRALVEALARHVPAALAAEEARGRAALRIERHRTVASLDATEWDSLLGDRGTFSVEGLRFLEQAFGQGERPEDRWGFHYYVVRDTAGRPVATTFFTSALWKDDMLSSASVSRLVEERRAEDPYYLTSQTFAMGSLLTEGDHLYVDRTGDWKAALDLLLAAVADDARAAGAATIVLRDLPTGDRELIEALRERGYVEAAMPESLAIEPIAETDDAWLAGLSSRSRAHQRREVLPFDGTFDVEFLRAGGRAVGDEELDHLHALYGNVRDRGLDINSFELPRTLLRDMLNFDCWELMILRRRDAPDAPPVAFGAHFVGAKHYAPMIVGLDYRFVQTHHSYRQALRQSLLRARALGASSMPLGMGATLEKRRFGASVHARSALVQSSEHYAAQVLASLSGDVAQVR